MANQPYCLVYNYFSDIAWPDHVLTADEEAAGHEVWRLADGRRSSQDYWAPSTGMAAHTVTVDCGISRNAQALALDRGHNLAGVAVTVKGSSDNFVADTHDVITATVPAAATEASDLSGANGVTTWEGAWLLKWTMVSYRYWRLAIPALGGTGQVPQIVGAYLGNYYQPPRVLLPLTDQVAVSVLQETMSDVGWAGNTYPVRRQQGELAFRLSSEFDTQQARNHIWSHFYQRRPMWIVHDDAYAERAVLTIVRPEPFGFPKSATWRTRRDVVVPWVEHQPALV